VSERARPQKPLRNPFHIAFPKTGAPYPVVEQLPREQEGLELSLGRKFLGALGHFNGIKLDELTRGAEPADLACRSPDGIAIGVQIVEVIDQERRELRHMRSTYRDAVVEMLVDDLRLFSGCQVSLVDSADSPYLPGVNSRNGRECLRLLAEDIRNVAAEIQTLEPDNILSRKIRTINPEPEIAVVVERFSPAGESIPFRLAWTGSGPWYRSDVGRGLLPAAIRSKIDKRYTKPASAKFWLLAYSVDSLLVEHDPDIASSQRLLETSRHPFDEVWFLYPYADRELGALVHVWPTNRDGY
jgi:hypothetical protein